MGGLFSRPRIQPILTSNTASAASSTNTGSSVSEKGSNSTGGSRSHSHSQNNNASNNSQNNQFMAVYDKLPVFTKEAIFEHYMPYEFPMCPVITSVTQHLVVSSWTQIVRTEYESADTVSGKISGASYFYNKFFELLFGRLNDFERIFPNIHSRANILSHVMAMCASVRVENLEFTKQRLTSLGRKHIQIVLDPWQFGIYATVIHATIRYCLRDDASADIMNAWMHLLAWILRAMLPHYFRDCSQFVRFYEGAMNSASVINNKAQIEIRNASEVKETRSEVFAHLRGTDRSGMGSGLPSRGGMGGVANSGNSGNATFMGSNNRGEVKESSAVTTGLTAYQRQQLANTEVDESSVLEVVSPNAGSVSGSPNLGPSGSPKDSAYNSNMLQVASALR